MCFSGSPYRDLISEAILKLKEDGKIQKLYKKWWETKAGGQCVSDDSAKTKDANELGVANVGGVFVVLLAGLAFAMLIVICEFVWKAKKNARDDKVNVSACCNAFCFVFSSFTTYLTLISTQCMDLR